MPMLPETWAHCVPQLKGLGQHMQHFCQLLYLRMTIIVRLALWQSMFIGKIAHHDDEFIAA